MNPNSPQKFQLIHNAWQYFKEYFIHSKERSQAWLYFIGAIACAIMYSILGFQFGNWLPSFWNAIQLKDLGLFKIAMTNFAWLAGGSIFFEVSKNFIVDSLYVNWREWKTKKILDQFLQTETKNYNYLDILRKAHHINALEQRIQEDIKSASYQSISLVIGFIQSTCRFSFFVGTLWQISGLVTASIFGLTLTIPGYLVIVALSFSAVATYLTHTIGLPLDKINTEQQTVEAQFRAEIKNITAQSESVSQEHGEVYFLSSLKHKMTTVAQNTRMKILVRRNLDAFQSFYSEISHIFPYLCASPMFFMGFISLSDLMRIGFAFNEVNGALKWFIKSYENLSIYKTNLHRIAEIDEQINNIEAFDNKKIESQTTPNPNIEIDNLTIYTPEGENQVLFKIPNLTFVRGESTLINGASGLGKSTLFKAISGAWQYGSGTIKRPEADKIAFLAQTPTLVNATLADELAFPLTKTAYCDKQYREVLTKVGGLDKFIDDIDTQREWTTILSGGQKQRIAFARALLQKPDWLFLDETTASLDPQNELEMYQLLQRELGQTTFISIAHRESVQRYHQKIITFDDIDEQNELRFSSRYSFFRKQAPNEVNHEETLTVNYAEV